MARAVAKRSRCRRAQVGAVIVDATNRIVATGYNGPPANLRTPEGDCGAFCPRGLVGPNPNTLADYSDCVTIHAEANALLFCDRRDRLNGTIFVTGHTCVTCAKLIANSGLACLVICNVEEDKRESRSADASYELLRNCGILVVEL